MSLYNMLFGMNPHSDLLLAVVGLRRHEVERFRDISVSADGTSLEVYTRTGGGNRSSYPNTLMRHLPGWQSSCDDDFDSTYCTDRISIPPEFIQDVRNLSDVLEHGLRPEFTRHLAKTLRRNPTESDLEASAYESERSALNRTRHLMANGHTFVPLDDHAMESALNLAESHGGELRSAWGILPISITIRKDKSCRAEIGYHYSWTIDEEYWKHCQELFATKYPVTMAKIAAMVSERKQELVSGLQ